MDSETLSIPNDPFLEEWSIRIKADWVASLPGKSLDRSAGAVYRRVVQHLFVDVVADEGEHIHRDDRIHDELMEIVHSHLSCPEFRYYVADYKERNGSWEADFLVVAVLYGGVVGYGGFRQGLEYIVKDIHKLLKVVPDVRARVSKRFCRRHTMRARKEPTIDGSRLDAVIDDDESIA